MPARAKREVSPETEGDEVVAVDDANEPDILTGDIPEGELELSRRVAKRMGWRPKEEWSGKPDAWRDAPDFLEDTPKAFQALRDRSERNARAAAEVLEEERRRAREEAAKVIETSDDPQERVKAAKRLADNAGPPPETQAWLGRNSWFHSDPDAQALAVGRINSAASRGLSVSDQLAEAEEAVRKRFPEHFGSPEPQRLSERRSSPPQVQAGSRATNTQPREKGWAQIPHADQDAAQPLVRKFMQRGESRAEAEARYGRSYWKVNA